MMQSLTRIIADRSVGALFFGNYHLMDYELMGGDARRHRRRERQARHDETVPASAGAIRLKAVADLGHAGPGSGLSRRPEVRRPGDRDFAIALFIGDVASVGLPVISVIKEIDLQRNILPKLVGATRQYPTGPMRGRTEVSGVKTRILKIGDQRLTRENDRLRPKIRKIALQRLRRISLTRGNVGGVFLRAGHGSLRPHWLADETVGCETGLPPKSLPKRENDRDFGGRGAAAMIFLPPQRTQTVGVRINSRSKGTCIIQEVIGGELGLTGVLESLPEKPVGVALD